jgi:hypothetical protein
MRKRGVRSILTPRSSSFQGAYANGAKPGEGFTPQFLPLSLIVWPE